MADIWNPFTFLETGRTYKTRSGSEVEITGRSGRDDKPFKSRCNTAYTLYGRYYGSDESLLDLVLVKSSDRIVSIDLDRPDMWPTRVHALINQHAQEMATTWHMSATLYEELRNAIDGGNESMEHLDALNWINSAHCPPSEEKIATWIRRFGYCTPEQADEMAEFVVQQLQQEAQ